MRKIEQQMITALRTRTNLSLGNTVVSWDDDDAATVLLHGNVIARYSKGCLASSQWVRCSPLAVVRAVLANTVSGSPVRTEQS